MQSNVYVKSYGLGSSATTSIRGGSAGHTQVMWNGLAIQNPMLGQLDFSLIPIGFVDDLSIAFGGNTAPWGSGSIGGTVFINNLPQITTGWSAKVRSELGHFGWWDQQAKLTFGKGDFQSVTRFFHQQATNDFEYEQAPGLPKRKQTNAALHQNGLMQEFYWNTNPRQFWSARVWLQETEREIPPRMVQTRSLAEQADRFIRTNIQWKNIQSSGVLTIKGGVFKEDQDYKDPLAGLTTSNDFWKSIAEIDQSWHLSDQQQLQIGTNHTWLQSSAGAYQQSRHQHRTAAFLLYRHHIGTWEAQFNLRQTLVDGAFVPIVPSLGITTKINDHFSVNGKVSRNYRLPTLNDLYWQPGGNPSLLPEKGWSQEIGINLFLQASQASQNGTSKSTGQLQYSATLFNRTIKDWIQWAVVDGQPFYAPHNITKVHSWGIEQRIKAHQNWGKTKLNWQLGYDYISSTYQQAVETPKFDKGAQLAYTPVHQWFSQLNFQFHTASLSYLHRYTGGVDTFNFTQLAPYHIGAVQLNYLLKKHRWNAQLFINIENIWDQQYQVIEYRAMPGRYGRIGCSFSFNKTQNI